MAAIVITDDSTRAEIGEALGHLVHAAKREIPVVGTAQRPTPWDRRHQAIDAYLTDFEDAPE